MVYDRNSRNDNPRGGFYGRDDPQDYGRDYGASNARDYAAAGGYDRGGRDRGGARDYGPREYGNAGYSRYDRDAGGSGYRGSYASDGRRFEDAGRYARADDDGDRDRASRGFGGRLRDYDCDERGFIARAGDEVRSWFGDEEAERRRDADARYDERGGRHDSDYHAWRNTQISALDRDYHEYRQENRARFENEFSTWRSTRQTQRDALGNVVEHMDVVGTDGAHVGTVDKVRDDRILLTKSDPDAGGRHHSIPSRWIDTVDDKVTLSKTAAEAKAAWEDEDRNVAMFGYGDNAKDRDRTGGGRDAQGRMLNRSFSGTY